MQVTHQSRPTKWPKSTKRSKTELRSYITGRSKESWSPQAIARRMKFEQMSTQVYYEKTCEFTNSPRGQKLRLYQYLVRKNSRRKVQGGHTPNKRTIPEHVPISERQEHINQRTEIGHVEADLAFCKGDKSTNGLTIVDRKTRFLLLAKNTYKHADLIAQSFIQAINQIKDMPIKSSTFDQGKEFTQHTLLKKTLGIKTFFCNSHSPWQKGQVENMNGRLRYFLSHKTDLKRLSTPQLQKIQDHMNNQSRKHLDCRAPKWVSFEELSVIRNEGYCCV